MTTSTSVQAYTDRRDFTRTRIPPLWEGRRGQIANLWLYAYCALLSAAWRAAHTFWHRYELLPDRLRITTGLYRPHIHTEEVDFDTVQTVRIEGFRLHALVNRGDLVLDRKGHLNSVRLEGIKNPEDLKTLIDGTLERWRRRQASARMSYSHLRWKTWELIGFLSSQILVCVMGPLDRREVIHSA